MLHVAAVVVVVLLQITLAVSEHPGRALISSCHRVCSSVAAAMGAQSSAAARWRLGAVAAVGCILVACWVTDLHYE